MLILLFCAAVLIAKAWPHSATGRVLHHLLIDLPAEILAKVTPGGVVSTSLMLLGAVFVLNLARGEGAFLVAQGLPEAFAWFLTFDVATYVDAIAIVWLIAATVRVRAALASLRARLGCPLRTTLIRRHAPRARARRARATPPPAANDDEPGWAPGPAFWLANARAR